MFTRRSVRVLRGNVAEKNRGFTLIELLVVIAIGGVLAAIAIPSFLSRANAAKQAEAKTFLGTLNRAQQAHYLQYAKFADNVNVLSTDRQPNYNYAYEIKVEDGGQTAIQYANPRIAKVRAYVGMSAIMYDASGNLAAQTILCQSEQPSLNAALDPVHSSTAIECAPGTEHLD